MQREIEKIKSEIFEISKGIHQILDLLKKEKKYYMLVEEKDSTSFSKMKRILDSVEEEG